jgi:hypothetical protein
MLSFEVRRYTGSRWLLDAVFDDKALAVAEAKALMARNRALSAVRVMAVAEDEDGFREWTIYKQSVINEDEEQAIQRMMEAPVDAPALASGTASAAGPRGAAPWLYYAEMAARIILLVGAGAFLLALLNR